MGIYAKGAQSPANVEADTPQNRYGGQFTNDSVAGEALGETLGEVNAMASSANTTAGELIADIEALEGRVATLEGQLSAAILAVPPANIADMPSGQVYLDVATLTIHTKD